MSVIFFVFPQQLPGRPHSPFGPGLPVSFLVQLRFSDLNFLAPVNQVTLPPRIPLTNTAWSPSPPTVSLSSYSENNTVL